MGGGKRRRGDDASSKETEMKGKWRRREGKGKIGQISVRQKRSLDSSAGVEEFSLFSFSSFVHLMASDRLFGFAWLGLGPIGQNSSPDCHPPRPTTIRTNRPVHKSASWLTGFNGRVLYTDDPPPPLRIRAVLHGKRGGKSL